MSWVGGFGAQSFGLCMEPIWGLFQVRVSAESSCKTGTGLLLRTKV